MINDPVVGQECYVIKIYPGLYNKKTEEFLFTLHTQQNSY